MSHCHDTDTVTPPDLCAAASLLFPFPSPSRCTQTRREEGRRERERGGRWTNPKAKAKAQQAQEAAHSPAEGSDVDVLMSDAAEDDNAAEPVVSGVPIPMQEPGGVRKWDRARKHRARKRKRRGQGGAEI